MLAPLIVDLLMGTLLLLLVGWAIDAFREACTMCQVMLIPRHPGVGTGWAAWGDRPPPSTQTRQGRLAPSGNIDSPGDPGHPTGLIPNRPSREVLTTQAGGVANEADYSSASPWS